MTRVAIRSVLFPGRFLRLDGTGVTSYTESGGGEAMIQTFVGSQETFILHSFPGGTVSFESVEFPRVFLRLDGTNVPAGSTDPSGGIVNGQYGSRGWEKFYVRKKEPGEDERGSVGIESYAFPGRFLRMGPDVVNVQGILASGEELEILVIG